MSVHLEADPSVLAVADDAAALAERRAPAGAGYAEVEGAIAGAMR